MTGVKALLAVVAAVAAALLVAPASASAHPLGNFTVNRYAGIEIAGNRVFVHYVLDLAEIPTYQLGDEVRKPGYVTRLARDLELSLDGRRVSLGVVDRRVVVRPGAGGLETLRLDVVYGTDRAGRELRFEDRTFANRAGWREITLSARDGAALTRYERPSRQLERPAPVVSRGSPQLAGGRLASPGCRRAGRRARRRA